MHNLEIAWVLQEIADLIELKQENEFKAVAYRKAARNVAKWTTSLSTMASTEILAIPGVGKNIGQVIEEIIHQGHSTFHQQLRADVPIGLLEVLAIPGIGVKMARTFYQELGITTLDELEAAAKARKIRKLSGMGAKTELTILRGIDLFRNGTGRLPIGMARTVALELLASIQDFPHVVEADLVGSLRRWVEMVGDIDILVATTDPEEIRQVITKYPLITEVITSNEQYCKVRTQAGLLAEIFMVGPQDYPFFRCYLTGSKGHLDQLRQVAQQVGLKIEVSGVYRVTSGEKIVVNSEEEIYQQLALPWIAPELREGLGEVEAAQNHALPQLITRQDIKGDLHLHSDWSDGVASLEELVQAGQELNYEYLAITDHSKSLTIAGGLSEARLAKQHQAIQQINTELKHFQVLTGIEVDILNNGLDYADELLAEVDIVIASVHSGFRQSEEQLTERVIAAIKNPHVDILAHPTGRLLGRRDPYQIDLERVFEAAAKYETIVEINASPDRLDLNDQAVKQATQEYGLKIAINTDAHHLSRLQDMEYGVSTGRRGWLTQEDVVNTWELKRLQRWLEQKR